MQCGVRKCNRVGPHITQGRSTQASKGQQLQPERSIKTIKWVQDHTRRVAQSKINGKIDKEIQVRSQLERPNPWKLSGSKPILKILRICYQCETRKLFFSSQRNLAKMRVSIVCQHFNILCQRVSERKRV